MTDQKKLEQIEVLLVDDDQGDIDLTLEVLEMSKLKLNMKVLYNGEECMRFLRKEGEFKDVKKPDLILLDLNMPRKDGRETLHEIKEDPELRLLPVVILTTSEANEDIVQTYAEGANCYISKPVGLDEFLKVIKAIEAFWLTVVKLPTKVA